MGEGYGGPRWRRGKHKKNFWRAWREERHHRHGEYFEEPGSPAHQVPPFSPGENTPGWRNFFHDYMGEWPEKHWAFGGRRFSPWHHGREDFNPFVASILSKGGGLLPLYVMHLLSEEPRYGNELMELITERTGGQWMANPGAIYPLMTMLEDQELVVGEWEDPRKRTVRIYKLTDEGVIELARLKTIVRPKLVEAIDVLRQLALDLNGETEDSYFSASDHDYI